MGGMEIGVADVVDDDEEEVIVLYCRVVDGVILCGIMLVPLERRLFCNASVVGCLG